MRKRFVLVLVALLVLAMAAGTFVQRAQGADFAISLVYHSWWFALMWAVLAVLGISALLRWGVFRRPAVLGIHLAFLLIMAGMMITAFFAQSGRIALLPEQAVASFQTDQGPRPLPFSLQLDGFEVVNYPGTQSPQDYIAYVTLDSTLRDTISINHILRHCGYRLYLSGYSAEGEVFLSVGHDPWGTSLNYAGYLLLLISMLTFFFDSQSRFRQLLRQTLPLMFLALSFGAVAAPRTLPRESADRLGKLCVCYQDRVCPISTLAKDFTTKLYGAPSYKGFSSEQVLAGWIFYYSDWKQEPMIKLKGAKVKDLFRTSSRYVSLDDYFDSYGQYRLGFLDTLAVDHPLYPKWMAANEKYQLISMLYGGQLLKIFPVADSSGSIDWYSQSDHLPIVIPDDEYLFVRKSLSYSQELVAKRDFAALDTLFEKTIRYQRLKASGVCPSQPKLKAEMLYNDLVPSRMVSIFCVMAGLVLFFSMILLSRPSMALSKILLLVELFYLLILFVLRWFASGHVPLGNGYETMLFLSLCIAVVSLAARRRILVAPAVGTLLVGVSLMVAMMGGSSPMITHLMPVLQSPLLCIHVALIMLSYALLALLAILSATFLFLPSSPQTLAQVVRSCQITIYPALFLLAAGIFVGAVWANLSWGSYWSWDPKEVWALITLIVYSLLLHGRSVSALQQPRPFLIYCLVAFLTVIITYFGVNLFLGGMHSYA